MRPHVMLSLVPNGLHQKFSLSLLFAIFIDFLEAILDFCRAGHVITIGKMMDVSFWFCISNQFFEQL